MAIIGVDSALKGLAIHILTDDGKRAFVEIQPPDIKDDWLKSYSLYKQLQEAVVSNPSLVNVLPAPVFIEDSIVGPNLRHSMDASRIVGFVRAAFHESGCMTVLVQSSTWKKDIIGNGKAQKHEIMRFLIGANPDLEEEFGDAFRKKMENSRARVNLPSDDFFDSYAIALWGRNTLKRASLDAD